MKKTIGLHLNEFVTTPPSLRTDPAVDSPAKLISVDPANLYHHYYKDKHGKRPRTRISLILSTYSISDQMRNFESMATGSAFRPRRGGRSQAS